MNYYPFVLIGSRFEIFFFWTCRELYDFVLRMHFQNLTSIKPWPQSHTHSWMFRIVTKYINKATASSLYSFKKYYLFVSCLLRKMFNVYYMIEVRRSNQYTVDLPYMTNIYDGAFSFERVFKCVLQFCFL